MHYQRRRKTGDVGPPSEYGRTGERNPKWRGGRHVRTYIVVYAPGHPHATKQGYVLEHRLVMEKALGRYLDPSEVVHHINHDRHDNRIANLELLPSQSEHMRQHYPERVLNEKGQWT